MMTALYTLPKLETGEEEGGGGHKCGTNKIDLPASLTHVDNVGLVVREWRLLNMQIAPQRG